MGTLASGQINVRTARLHFDGSLQDLVAVAGDSLYPKAPDGESSGWGSFSDDESIIGLSSRLRVHASRPRIEPEGDGKSARAHLRFYFDKVDNVLKRRLSEDNHWWGIYLRQAVDVIIFDGDAEAGFPVHISSRLGPDLTKRIFPALKGLALDIDERAYINHDLIPEAIDPDLFTWLLASYSQGTNISDNLSLDRIREMNSADGLFQGARYSDDASVARPSIATLLLEGGYQFGPAKFTLTSVSRDLTANLELHLDGGFSVFRTSSYGDDDEITDQEKGIRLVEDVADSLLPELRAAYGEDAEWRRSGLATFLKLANANVARLVQQH